MYEKSNEKEVLAQSWYIRLVRQTDRFQILIRRRQKTCRTTMSAFREQWPTRHSAHFEAIRNRTQGVNDSSLAHDLWHMFLWHKAQELFPPFVSVCCINRTITASTLPSRRHSLAPLAQTLGNVGACIYVRYNTNKITFFSFRRLWHSQKSLTLFFAPFQQ